MSIFKSLVGNRSFEHMYVENWEVLKIVVEALKVLGAKVVLTQGVFDMYHIGHGLYLQEASKCGDVLIVGVDSDALTKERKGPKRPLDGEMNRVRALSLIAPVDILTLRPSTKSEPLDALVRLIHPDVLVTSESTPDVQGKILEALGPLCGEIITLPPQASTSTTARLRKVALDGAGELATCVQDAVNKYLSEMKGG